MPTKKQAAEIDGTKPEEEMTLNELTALLIKHFDHHEGRYDLAIHLQIATGAIGPDKDNLLPGAMLGIAGVGLKRVETLGSNTLDAADVNPAPKAKPKAKPKTKKKAAKPPKA